MNQKPKLTAVLHVCRMDDDLSGPRLVYELAPSELTPAQALLDSAAMLFASARAIRPDFTVENLLSIARPYSREDDALIRGSGDRGD